MLKNNTMCSTISNSNFVNIKNDAIDFSGSKAKLKNIKFSNIGDKLVSVGENSIVDINDIIGKDSYAGLASKDGSILKGNNINFNNVNIPFSSYVKKSEYDGAILKVAGLLIANERSIWDPSISKDRFCISIHPYSIVIIKFNRDGI